MSMSRNTIEWIVCILPDAQEHLAQYDIARPKDSAYVARQLNEYFGRDPEAYARYRAERGDRGDQAAEGARAEDGRAQSVLAEAEGLAPDTIAEAPQEPVPGSFRFGRS